MSTCSYSSAEYGFCRAPCRYIRSSLDTWSFSLDSFACHSAARSRNSVGASVQSLKIPKFSRLRPRLLGKGCVSAFSSAMRGTSSFKLRIRYRSGSISSHEGRGGFWILVVSNSSSDFFSRSFPSRGRGIGGGREVPGCWSA